MHVDADLLNLLITHNKKHKLDFMLYLGETQYRLTDVSIADSATPVTRPTVRGGVYFSEKFEHRISGVIGDLAVIPMLSKTMLGPNTEFDDIEIRTSLHHNGKILHLHIFANLTSSVQRPSDVELHMVLVGLVHAQSR